MNESPISAKRSRRNVILCANVKAGAAVLLSVAALAFACIFLANVLHGFSIIAAVMAIGLTAFVVICRPNKETMNPVCGWAFVSAVAAVISYPIFSQLHYIAGKHAITFLDNAISGAASAVAAAVILIIFMGFQEFFIKECEGQ